ncbi:MAG: SRPBCC domain-containing protein [Candidatus Bathyarchaeota archaeon]|nr:SRPBCC domain-containing protein [Candidatus Bathyarchaeota archaeon]
MSNNSLEVGVSIQIQKPMHEVYEAIVDPAKMTQYFISKSSGRIETGKNLTWRYPEFDMEFPIRVKETKPNEYVSYYWNNGDKETLVEMTLKQGINKATIVNITEKDMPNDEAGINWLKGNTEGWTNFLSCLKAYLEYGVNLRKGAFTYRKM